MLSVTNKPYMLNVVMLNIVKLSVVASFIEPLANDTNFEGFKPATSGAL
jgi:hypothetical protein